MVLFNVVVGFFDFWKWREFVLWGCIGGFYEENFELFVFVLNVKVFSEKVLKLERFDLRFNSIKIIRIN